MSRAVRGRNRTLGRSVIGHRRCGAGRGTARRRERADAGAEVGDPHVASSPFPVVVEGESGTGKTLIAEQPLSDPSMDFRLLREHARIRSSARSPRQPKTYQFWGREDVHTCARIRRKVGLAR